MIAAGQSVPDLASLIGASKGMFRCLQPMLDSQPLQRLVYRVGRVDDLPPGLDRLACLDGVLLAAFYDLEQRPAADRLVLWKAAVAKMPALESSHRSILTHLIMVDATADAMPTPPKELAALVAALAPHLPTMSVPDMDLVRAFDQYFVAGGVLTPGHMFKDLVAMAVGFPAPLRIAPLKALAAEVGRMSPGLPCHSFKAFIADPILAATTALDPEERARMLVGFMDQNAKLSLSDHLQSETCEMVRRIINDHPLPVTQRLRLQARLMTVELPLLLRSLPVRLQRLVQQPVLRLMSPQQLALLRMGINERVRQLHEQALPAGGGAAALPQGGLQPGAGPFPMAEPPPWAPWVPMMPVPVGEGAPGALPPQGGAQPVAGPFPMAGPIQWVQLLQVPPAGEGLAGLPQWPAQPGAGPFPMPEPMQDPPAH